MNKASFGNVVGWWLLVAVLIIPLACIAQPPDITVDVVSKKAFVIFFLKNYEDRDFQCSFIRVQATVKDKDDRVARRSIIARDVTLPANSLEIRLEAGKEIIGALNSEMNQPRIVDIGEISYSCQPVAFSQQAFVGTWVNDDTNTRGMTRLIIGMKGKTVTVHGYGKCHPSDCDWGKITASGNPFRAVYKHGFVTNTLTIKLVSKNALHVHSTKIFHDGTNRDYEADYYMHRKPNLLRLRPFILSPSLRYLQKP